ncbi:MAG: hypothetical protein ABFD89_03840 [Bryobacteraceae bacterium]
MALDCTPAGIASISQCRCLNCLSVSQLRTLLLMEWANLMSVDLGDQAERDQLLADSACFTCLGEKQRLEALVCMFGEIAFDERFEQLGTIVDQMKCLPCMSTAQVEAALQYLICTYIKGFLELET